MSEERCVACEVAYFETGEQLPDGTRVKEATILGIRTNHHALIARLRVELEEAHADMVHLGEIIGIYKALYGPVHKLSLAAKKEKP